MKTSRLLCFFLLLATVNLRAQMNAAAQPQDTPYAIVSKSLNSRVWERTTYEAGTSGQSLPHLHRYTELATGLHYIDPQTGQLAESEEQIDLLPNGSAQAIHGQHSVFFPVDIYSGVLELVAADGQHFKSRPAAVVYSDGTNSVIIALLTNSVGQLVSSNQVIYPNAFAAGDFGADIQITYRRYGLECDLVLRSQPPPPETFGLDAANCRMQLLTEFFDTKDPDQITPQTTLGSAQNANLAATANTSASHQSDIAPEANDPLLNFGAMSMAHGKAFSINPGSVPVSSAQIQSAQSSVQGQLAPAASADQVPVLKSWAHTADGRTFLIESVSVPGIAPQLQTLPASGAGAVAGNSPARRPLLQELASRSKLHRVSAGQIFPPRRIDSARNGLPAGRGRLANGTTGIQVAKASSKSKPGVVLDYILVNTDQNAFVFQGDETYYIANFVNFNGLVTFEGGTVIKFNSDTNIGPNAIQINANVQCNTSEYRPAVFTSQNDNTIGEALSVAGTPMQYWQALADATSGDDLHDICIRYAICGIQGPDLHVADSQFVQCARPLWNEWGTLYATNILIVDADAPFSGQNFTATVYHLTLDGCTNLILAHYFPSWTNNTLVLTNCLLTGVISNGFGTLIADHTAWPAPTEQVYQVVGAGNYYLANGSPYRNDGTTNIGPGPLADLQQKTTYPPILYSNVVFSNNLVLNPQAQRDYDTPDLGYHYDPIDYLVDEFSITNATLIVTNGAVLAGYNDQDVIVTDGSSIVSVGTPLAPNWFTRYSCVQEEPLFLGSTNGTPTMVNPYHATIEPAGLFRFTKFSCPAAGGYHLIHEQCNWAYSNLWVQDCEFWGGKNDFSGCNNIFVALKNNLFARSTISTASGAYTNNSLVVSNNLFWNTSFVVRPGQNSNAWFFFNNDFDNSVVHLGPGTQNAVNGYNAYLVNTNRLSPTNAFDIVTNSDIAYQTGPLGAFYQPTNSILINVGSTNANLVGLYHYTVTTNEVTEGFSQVDIGYHYVALDASGNPIDSNGDGIPDYLEDVNGNGIVDLGELPWGITIDSPANGSILY